MPEIRYFHCANDNKCHYSTVQREDNVGQELDGYKLCYDCVSRGFRLRQGVTVVRLPEKELRQKQDIISKKG